MIKFCLRRSYTCITRTRTKDQGLKRQLMFFKLSAVVKFKLSTPQLINPILVLHFKFHFDFDQQNTLYLSSGGSKI